MNRKRKCCVLLYLTVVMWSMETSEASLRASTVRSIQQIKSSMGTSGRKVTTRLDKVKELLEKGNEHSEIAATAIETMGDNIGSIMSSDPAKIVTGVLNLVSSIAGMIPVGGTMISTIFSLFSTVIGLIGAGDGGGTDMASVVKKAIETTLSNYDDSNLRSRAQSTAIIYSSAQSYLAVTEGRELQEHDLAALVRNIDITNGVAFLGILKNKIQNNVVSKDLSQVRRAMEYTQLYVLLATLRSAVLWQLYSTILKSGNNVFTAAGTKSYTQMEEAADKRFIKYLEVPEYNTAIFFASLSMSEWPVVSKYMQLRGLKYQDLSYLSKTRHYFRPQKWTNWYMVMTFSYTKSLAGSKIASNAGSFFVDKLGDNFFHLRSTRWPTWYVYMSSASNSHVRGSSSKPGPQGEWKIVKYSDGKYMLSPRKWPNYFIYMSSNSQGTILGYIGDPGSPGHWLI